MSDSSVTAADESRPAPSRWRRAAAKSKAAADAWYLQSVVGPVRSRCGLLSRRLQFPNIYNVPHRRSALAVSRDGALGDVLMCTPALRVLKALNPNCRLSFYTMYPALLEGLPFIDMLGDWDSRPARTIYLRYEDSVPPRRHIAQVMGDYLGVNVVDVTPSCSVDARLVEELRSSWRELPRPWTVINRFAGPHTPNKDWPDAFWRSLVDRLAEEATVIEIGTHHASRNFSTRGNYVNLVQRTSISELVATIAAADLHVGPISGPVHIAAAAGTPSVVIYGGYEHPMCSSYEGNINLYSPIACSPCWLTAACPYQTKCLSSISVDRVRAAIDSLWRARKSSAAEIA